jgi:hypothetical protein
MQALKVPAKIGATLHQRSQKWRRNCISSLSKSVRLDVRLVLNGSTAMLKLSMGIGIHIELSELKASRHHTLDLLFPVVGSQASYREKGYLFVSVFLLLFIYKPNGFTGSYEESTSCPF